MKINNEEINNDLSGFPEYLVKLINESLDAKDFGKRLSAKDSMVNMGKTIIPQLHKLLCSKNDSLRM